MPAVRFPANGVHDPTFRCYAEMPGPLIVPLLRQWATGDHQGGAEGAVRVDRRRTDAAELRVSSDVGRLRASARRQRRRSHYGQVG